MIAAMYAIFAVAVRFAPETFGHSIEAEAEAGEGGAVPVVGIGEASLREVTGSDRRFGIATTTPELEAPIVAVVERLGLAAPDPPV